MKYYNINDNPAEIPSRWDGTYKLAVVGEQHVDAFTKWWAENPNVKKGAIFQIFITPECDIFDNASSFLYMLQRLTRPEWDNGVPAIFDFSDTPLGNKPTLDDMTTLKVYIHDHYQLRDGQKFLLRLNGNTWRSWCTKNEVVAERLLEVFDILLCQPGSAKPDILPLVGNPKWWEYTMWGKYWNDPTGMWLKDPVTPPVDPPVEPPTDPVDPPVEPPVDPVDPPVVPPVSVEIPKEWTVEGKIWFMPVKLIVKAK